MGYLLCTAVLVVTFGRLGDMLGRVRMYNVGFAVFTIMSIALSLTPGQGSSAALYLVVVRVFQGIGGALLMANSTAILFDVFPPNQRGLAMGINSIAAISGQFIGLVVGGLLADWNWRSVFLISVPFGIFGTIWAYLKLQDIGVRSKFSLDWWGNLTFALGLVAILIGITYGIQPYKDHSMGWTSPQVIAELILGIMLLVAFIMIENRVKNPMFNLQLFRIRAFTAGNLANLLSSIGRGGLQFMLIIWLQGIWLPLHGYSFESTPLWAGIYMVPLTVGFLIIGPVSGHLSDRFGAKEFATGGMLISALSFGLLMLLHANFYYWAFAGLLLLNGLGNGLFAAPNSTAIMNAVSPNQRGQASGMRATFMNAAMVLSIGVFFSLMIAALSSALPHTIQNGLVHQRIPVLVAEKVAGTPPVASLFAAFLGYNPMAQLIPAHVLRMLPDSNVAYLTGKTFFPDLISNPFIHGLRFAFSLSFILFIIAAIASWMQGERYVHGDNLEIIKDEADAIDERFM